VITIRVDRQTAQDRIPISGAAVPAIFSDAEVKLELFRNRPNVVHLVAGLVHPDHFLKRNDVCSDFFQDRGDSLGSHTPIETSALVYVVSCDA
jgi:hypothetical protein